MVDEITKNHQKQQDEYKDNEHLQATDILLPDKNRILPKAKRKKMSKNIPKDPFETRAKEIVENITRLREFLAEHRSAYIDVLNISGSSGNSFESGDARDPNLPSGLTDLARDKIDAGANAFIRETNLLIAKFKADIKGNNEGKVKSVTTGAQIQHLEYVCDILENYLRSACQSHAKQKAIRVQKELELQKLSRLELNVKSTTAPLTPNSFKQSKSSLDLKDDRSSSGSGDDSIDATSKRSKSSKKSQKAVNDDDIIDNTSLSTLNNSMNSASSPAPDVNNSKVGYQYSSDEDEANKIADISLSPEEIQAYEQENEAMYEDLVSLRDNIKQIETKVVKIAQLQEVFTEKVLQQKDDIDLIANHAVSSTENMTNANEELRKAIQRNASLRVYILFFLLVMSFTLIFLDWYND